MTTNNQKPLRRVLENVRGVLLRTVGPVNLGQDPITVLYDIAVSKFGLYTDLPIKECLFVENIVSVQKVRDVNSQMVALGKHN